MPTQKLTNDIIAAAIDGFEAQKRKIDEQINELRAMLSGVRPEIPVAAAAPPKRKRRMSAAGRRAIAEATRKRWAAFHAARKAAATPAKAAAKGVPEAPAKTARKRMPIEKAAAKKAVAKKTAPVPAQTGTEAAAQ